MSDVNSRYQYKFYRKFVLICVYSNIMILVGSAQSIGSLYSTWCNLQQSAASCTVPMVVVMISSVSNGIEKLFTKCSGMQRLFNRCNGTVLLFSLKNPTFPF